MKLVALSDIKTPGSTGLGKIDKNQVFTCNEDYGKELVELGVAKETKADYKEMTFKSEIPKIELKVDGNEKQLDKVENKHKDGK